MSRSFTHKFQDHNVGASAMGAALDQYIMANQGNAGATSPADGSTCPACPRDQNPQVWRDVWLRWGRAGCARLCNLSGGTPGLGYGGMAPSYEPPRVEVDDRGCNMGWNQAKQPMGIGATAVVAGGIVPISLIPRKTARAYQYIYHGPADTFAFTSMDNNGVQMLGSSVAVNMDAWAELVTDHSIDTGEFSATTPLALQVQNTSGAPATFTGTFMVIASR